jgi:RHS repeat-associated protein
LAGAWCLALAGLVLLGLAVRQAGAETLIPATTYHGPVTWTADGSPYRVSGHVNVASDGVLTLEPGVRVLFAAGCWLDVYGALVAQGTPTARIVLASESGQPGGWYGLYLERGSGGSSLSYCDVRDGAGSSSYPATVMLAGGTLAVDQCTVSNSKAAGVGWGGVGTLTATRFYGNAGPALTLSPGVAPPGGGGNTADGNGRNAFLVTGDVGADQTFPNPGIPYECDQNLGVASGARLTLEAGTRLRMAEGTYLNVHGELTALGTAANPVILTGQKQQPGAWVGVFLEGANHRLSYCDVSFAGGTDYRMSVTVGWGSPASADFDHCAIRDSSSRGVVFTAASTGSLGACTLTRNADVAVWCQSGSAPRVSGCTFEQNASYPLRYDATTEPNLGPNTFRDAKAAIRMDAGTTNTGRFLLPNAGLPYDVIAKWDVGSGTTLILEPGVTLRFAGGWLDVYGLLLAEGTPERRITFTSASDAPKPGDWMCLFLEARDPLGPPSRLANCDFLYAGDASYRAALHVGYGAPTPAVVEGCTFSHTQGNAVVWTGTGSLSNCSFTNNAGWAVAVPQLDRMPTLSNLSAAGNQFNGVQLHGAVAAQARLDGGVGIPYLVDGHVDVARGATLTLGEGADLRFLGEFWLDVFGTLKAVGTPQRRISLSSGRAEPKPGDWDCIFFEQGSKGNELAFVDLAHAGAGDRYYAGINVGYGGPDVTADISNLRISQVRGHGIFWRDGSGSVSNTSVVGCAGSGLEVAGSGTLTVRDSLFANSGASGVHSTSTGVVSLARCTLAGNSAPEGALYAAGTDLTLSGSIVAFNSAGVAGDARAKLTLQRNDVFGNAAFDYGEGLAGSDDLHADPAFVNRGTGDYRLTSASPCVDAGDATSPGPGVLDLDGLPRLQGTRVDLGAYELPTGSAFVLRGLSPLRAGSGGSATLRVWGSRFTPGLKLRLSSTTLGTLQPKSVSVPDAGDASATFDLTGAPLGRYDVVGELPDGQTSALLDAFQVVAPEAPRYFGAVRMPSALRPNREYVAWVEYGNDGTSDLPPPLLTLSSPQGVPMRLSRQAAYGAGPAFILGIALDGDARTLRPASRYQVPVFFRTGDGTTVQLDLKLGTPGSQQAGLDAVAGALKPSGTDPQGWSALWTSLQEQLGATPAALLSALTADAAYLAGQGLRVCDVDRLLDFEAGRAEGLLSPHRVLARSQDAYQAGRGLPLAFSRAYVSDLTQRFHLGPLGRGWAGSFDYSLSFPSDLRAEVRTPTGGVRLFTRYAGKWMGQAGDYARLEPAPGSAWALVEKGGLTRTFSPQGRLATVSEPAGSSITLAYQGDLLSSATHTNGRALTFAYNAQNRLAQVTDSAGRAASYTYDPSGEYLVSVKSWNGLTTSYTYLPPTGARTDHALSTVATPGSGTLSYAYDARGRLTGEVATGQPILSYAYADPATVTLTDGEGYRFVESMGPELAPLTWTAPGDQTTRFAYDEAANLTRLTRPDGAATEAVYDAQGNAVRVIDPLQARLALGYDSRTGALNELADALGRQTRFGIDATGRVKEIRYPDAGTQAAEYNGAGDLIAWTNRRGQTVRYEYDGLGRLVRKALPDGRSVAFGYNDRDLLVSAADSVTGAMIFEYDAKGRLTKMTDGAGHWLSYAYDASGRLSGRATSDGGALTYSYNAWGRLERLSDTSGATLAAYEYDRGGRLLLESRGDGSAIAYEYGTDGRLLRTSHRAASGLELTRSDLTYDAAGRRQSLTVNGVTTHYSYDAAGQLTGFSRSDGRQASYDYDAAGNRKSLRRGLQATPFVSGPLDQLLSAGGTTYAYDADGNLVGRTDAAGSTTVTYDAENRLTAVLPPTGGGRRYLYDALGNRSGVLGPDGQPARYLVDPTTPGGIAAEYDGTGALVTRYAQGLGLVARQDAGSAPAYFSFDPMGNTRLVTDAAGAVVARYDYDPFGEPVSEQGTLSNPYRFSGRFGARTEPSGQVAMGARFYDPAMGRFTQPDPLGVAGGVNLYQYAGNQPTGFVDPTGTQLDDSEVAQTHSPVNWGTLSNVGIGLVAGGTILITGGAAAIFWGAAWGGTIAVSVGVGSAALGGAVVYSGVGGRGMRNHNPAEINAANGAGAMVSLATTQPTEGSARALGEGAATTYSQQAVDPNRERPGGSWSSRFCEGLWNLLDHGSLSSQSAPIVRPRDPNEKAGPTGTGDASTERFIHPGEDLTYVIYFENQKTAQAPAQEVFVTDQLSPALDWSTFRLGEVAFGDQVVTGLAGQEGGTTTVRAGQWDVEVKGQRDPQTGKVQWTLRTLDPATGELPEDAMAGFLPPNDSTGRGEGHVTFTLRARSDQPAGTRVTNAAGIVFDTNAAINTNEVWNTLQPLTSAPTGDVNGDGRLSIADVVMALKATAGLIQLTPAQLNAADINRNGRMDISDVVTLLKKVAGLIP